MAHRSQPRQIRATIACSSRIESKQLQADLSPDASLVVNAVADVAELKKQIEQTRPDVIVLDFEFADQDIPALIRDVLETSKIPSLVRAVATASNPLLDCLDAGAVGIVDKPASLAQQAESIPGLIWNLHAAARASVENLLAVRSAQWPAISPATSDGILAIGGGLGSLTALNGILSQMPASTAGVVAIAPLPAMALPGYVKRLASRCRIPVKLASQGDLIRPGQILIAPGDSHTMVRPSGNGYTIALKPGPAVFNQKPSIEMLFGSIADTMVGNAVAVLLGGGGVDGVAGLLSLKNRGGRTIAESSATSVLRDAPNLANACKAADAVERAENIATRALEFTAAGRTLRAA